MGKYSSLSRRHHLLNITSLLDPSNITTPPPISSDNDSGTSDAVLGVAITFAVLVPVALGILLFWYCKRRRNRKSEGQKEYLRTLENQDKARKFGQQQHAELESPIIQKKGSLTFSNNTSPASNIRMPFSNNFSPSSNTQMPFSNTLSPSSNRQLPFSNNASPSSNRQLPFSNNQSATMDSELPVPGSYIPFSKKVSIYEMDATSVHGTGKNKALPTPR